MITGGHEYHQGVEADGPSEIRKAVRAQVKVGVDWIKLMASGGVGGDESSAYPQMTFEEIRAAVLEAERFGKRVAVHAHPATAIKDAVRAGAASIEHGTFLDDECVELMRRTGAFLVPTIAAYESIVNSAEWPDLFLTPTHAWLTPGGQAIAKQVVERKLRTLKEVIGQGVRWGVGTDSTGLHLPHNRFSSELRLLHEAGLDRTEILLQATKGNAQLLGIDEKTGSLEPGKYADFVILEGDPTQDLAAAERVYCTVKAGRVYWPRGLAGMNMGLTASPGDQSPSQVADRTKTRIV
jgi:imidazolonepropionase-like amidohydrolase